MFCTSDERLCAHCPLICCSALIVFTVFLIDPQMSRVAMCAALQILSLLLLLLLLLNTLSLQDLLTYKRVTAVLGLQVYSPC